MTERLIITIDITDWRDVDVGEHREIRRMLIRKMLNAADKVSAREDITIRTEWRAARRIPSEGN